MRRRRGLLPQRGDGGRHLLRHRSRLHDAAALRAPAFPRGYGLAIASREGRWRRWCRSARTATGANAFALNANAPAGVNLNLNAEALVVSARGNQWEHCGTASTCDLSGIEAGDVRQGETASFDPGIPVHAATGKPVIRRVAPLRPARGDVVRVYGQGFDAVSAADCAGAEGLVSACSIENPAVAGRNQQTGATRLRLLDAGGETLTTSTPMRSRRACRAAVRCRSTATPS